MPALGGRQRPKLSFKTPTAVCSVGLSAAAIAAAATAAAADAIAAVKAAETEHLSSIDSRKKLSINSVPKDPASAAAATNDAQASALYLHRLIIFRFLALTYIIRRLAPVALSRSDYLNSTLILLKLCVSRSSAGKAVQPALLWQAPKAAAKASGCPSCALMRTLLLLLPPPLAAKA